MNDNRFTCAESLDTDCGAPSSDVNVCPSETQCIYTTDYEDNSEFYSCGLLCGGSICSLAGAQQMNSNYEVYCDSISDQCGICASAGSLSSDSTTGGCAQPVIAEPPAPSSARRRSHPVRRRLDMQKAQDLGCPLGTRRCGSSAQYHCMDISNDIDSCGGCPEEGGVSCYGLPGTLLGDTTCAKGKCISTRCDDEYELWQGSCLQPQIAARFKDSVNIPTKVIDTQALRNARHRSRRDNAGYKITNRKQGEIKWWQNVTIFAGQDVFGSPRLQECSYDSMY